MIPPRFLALALLIAAVATVAERAAAAPPPGPPWPVNYPSVGQRSADEAPTETWAVADLGANSGPVGVAVNVRAAIAKPKIGQEYELRYQLRVHTKKGEAGPLLGTKDMPAGTAFHVHRVKCEYDWIEFYETFDITRKELATLTNLPKGEQANEFEVFIRVEPQIYDVTEKKYITALRPPAAMLVANVGPQGQVWSVQSLSGWLVERSRGFDVKKTIARFADLDEYSSITNGIESAFNTVIASKGTSKEIKLAYITAVPSKTLKTKAAYQLFNTLEELANSDDEDLKNAAKQKLDEAK